MKHMFLHFTILISGALNACGDEQETDGVNPPSDPSGNPLTAEATFKISDATYLADNGSYKVSNYIKCQKDLASGLFTVTLSDSANVFDLRIRNFVNSPKTYTCSQSKNNATDHNDLGDGYNTCMVDIQAQSADAEGFSGYSMHRSSLSMSPFSYAGECYIDIGDVGAKAVGTVSCSKMIQSYLNSDYRNPISDDVYADISAEFSCDLQKE